jgi:hypothetical protein
MKLSRRKFIKAGAMVAAFAGVSLTTGLADAQKSGSRGSNILTDDGGVPAPQKLDMLGFYNMSTFVPYVNTAFRVRMASSPQRTITLSQIKGTDESFSLTFVGPRGKLIPQNTYEISHPALGDFYLFLVPVGMRALGKPEYFEAVINRSGENSAYTTSTGAPLVNTAPADINTAPVYSAPAFDAPSGSDVPVSQQNSMPVTQDSQTLPSNTKRNRKIEDQSIDAQWGPGVK